MSEELTEEQEHKIYMTEERTREMFVRKHIPIFAEMINVKKEKIRLYSIELPIKTDKDGTKYADIILEIVGNGDLFDKNNKLLVLEFKRKKVDYQSAVAQA